MKKIISLKEMYFVCALLIGMSWTSCSDDDETAIPIKLASITTIADLDKVIVEAALGDFIAVHGTGLDTHNIDSILIDDVKVDMQEVYTENSILFMKIPVKWRLIRPIKSIFIIQRAVLNFLSRLWLPI